MRFHFSFIRWRIAGQALALSVTLAALAPMVSLAQDDPRAFPETGYTITDEAIWAYFEQYGGTSTFGAPISREFLLSGAPVQLFENATLQVQPDGSVVPLQLAEGSLLGYTRFNGLPAPSTDAALAFVTPDPD